MQFGYGEVQNASSHFSPCIVSKQLGTKVGGTTESVAACVLVRPEVDGTHAYSDHMHVRTLTTVLLPAGPITTSDKSDHRLRYGNYIARLATTCRTKVLNRWLRFSDQRPSLVGGRHFNRREPHLAVITIKSDCQHGESIALLAMEGSAGDQAHTSTLGKGDCNCKQACNSQTLTFGKL